MIASIEQTQKQVFVQNIPKYLIREEINGKPYFYKGYKAVLNKQIKLEDIMGASGLQSMIIHVLLKFLYRTIKDDSYLFLTNEIGGHLSKGTNLSFDLAIFDKAVLTADKINEHYVAVPPKIVVEIDVKIETEDENAIDYVNQKTDKLLTFGVETVIWILTKSQKIIIAQPNKAWQTINWNQDIELLEKHTINIQKMLESEGVKLTK